MGIDKNGGRRQHRRLRKLCDLDEHPLKQVDPIIDVKVVKTAKVKGKSIKRQIKLVPDDQVREMLILNKVRGLDATDEKDLAKIVALGIISRNRGFILDERISRGDVRDTTHTQCSSSILYFELVRRSSNKATTLEKCKAEWVTNEQVGIGGWFCVGGLLVPSTLVPLTKERDCERMVWLDDPRNENWIEGQCLCMQTRGHNKFGKIKDNDDDKSSKRAIKFRYSIRNVKTNQVVVLGSTCIKNWGGEFARRANDLYKWAVRPVHTPVPVKKWLFQ